MSNTIPIKYHFIWTNLFILIGVFSGIIFLIGGTVLNDFTIYLYVIIAILPIYTGVNLKKINYAEVSKNNIKVYGLFGQLKHHYRLKGDDKFFVKNNNIYLKQAQKTIKIKMNSWFVNQLDWQNAIELFSLNENEKITKHLIDDEI